MRYPIFDTLLRFASNPMTSPVEEMTLISHKIDRVVLSYGPNFVMIGHIVPEVLAID